MSLLQYEDTAPLHLTADPKDLSCPICFFQFGLEENQPMTTHCGHTICSDCLEKVHKCPFCQVFLNKRQKHQKSVFICSMIANIKKDGRCKDHMVPYQGFCMQDKSFVCFDCLMEKHRGHSKVTTVKQINEKAKELGLETKKIYEKESSRRLEIRQSLDQVNKNLKRRIDERYDDEIEEFSLVKKKLYKDVDVTILTEKDHYEHKLLSENLIKHCKSTEKALENWNTKQEENLAFRILDNPLEKISQEMVLYEKNIDLIKTEITQKEAQYAKELTGNLASAINFLAKPPSHPTISNGYFEIERDYLIEVFKEYNMTAAWAQDNHSLDIQTCDFSTVPPQFNTKLVGSFSFTKLSLKYFDIPSSNISIICKILKNTPTLQDLTLSLPEITDEELVSLSDLLVSLKSLEKFSLSMDLTWTSQMALAQFFVQITSLKNFSSFTLQSNDFQILIAFQLATSSTESLQRMSIGLEAVPPLLFRNFYWLLGSSNISQGKSLKALKILLGKGEKSSLLAYSLCRILQAQGHLEELEVTTSEDFEGFAQYNFLQMLPGALLCAFSLKKLSITVNQATLASYFILSQFPQMIPLVLQNIEELAFNVKCSQIMWANDLMYAIVSFVLNARRLKKFAVKVDGFCLEFFTTLQLFDEILRMQNLVDLDLEFVNYKGLVYNQEKSLKDHLSKLPPRVSSNLVLQMAYP